MDVGLQNRKVVECDRERVYQLLLPRARSDGQRLHRCHKELSQQLFAVLDDQIPDKFQTCLLAQYGKEVRNGPALHLLAPSSSPHFHLSVPFEWQVLACNPIAFETYGLYRADAMCVSVHALY